MQTSGLKGKHQVLQKHLNAPVFLRPRQISIVKSITNKMAGASPANSNVIKKK
jgi:hypothetical protein